MRMRMSQVHVGMIMVTDVAHGTWIWTSRAFDISTYTSEKRRTEQPTSESR